MRKLKILVACEKSQAVTIAFRERGHLAYSCDIEPCTGGHPGIARAMAEQWGKYLEEKYYGGKQ